MSIDYSPKFTYYQSLFENVYIFKIFSFRTVAYKKLEIVILRQNRNHDYRVNNLMRNNLNLN